MADPFIGEIRMFAGNFAPRGFAFCNGDTLSIAEHATLYAVIGTKFGGNGRTTMKLPNLQGRAPMHWGTGRGLTPRKIGDHPGTVLQELTEDNLPKHNHGPWTNSKDNPNNIVPTGNYVDRHLDAAKPAEIFKKNPELNATFSPQSLSMEGGSDSHPNMQPFQTLTFIIALVGEFPNRN